MIRSFKLKPWTVHEWFGDETVIMNLDSGNYYSAQGLSDFIWNLVCDGASEAGILRRIKAEFSGNGDEISRATAQFLDKLVDEALVEAQYVAEGDGVQVENNPAEPAKVFSVPLLQKYTDMEEMLLLDPIHDVDEHGWPSTRKSAD
jgi:hypothetical protein